MSGMLTADQEALRGVLQHLGLAYGHLTRARETLPESAGRLAKASVEDARETLGVCIEAVEEAGR